MDLNFFGSTKVTRAVLSDMKLTPDIGGHVVFVASQGGLIGLYGLSTYCATKFAIRGFAESLAMGKLLEMNTFINNLLFNQRHHFIDLI